jgi:hypothetical protein
MAPLHRRGRLKALLGVLYKKIKQQCTSFISASNCVIIQIACPLSKIVAKTSSNVNGRCPSNMHRPVHIM